MSIKWYRIILSTIVEAKDEEDAEQQICAEVPDCIIESVTFIEEVEEQKP